MALFSISNVRITGVSAAVPKQVAENREHPLIKQEDILKFIETTGVERRRVVPIDISTSDLCFAAALQLLKDLNWAPSEVEALIFVSQTGDFILPVTSALLQERLGLSKECIAFDIPLGCSGYVYGASVMTGMIASGQITKGLLLVGDTISKLVSPKDKSTEPLFGDAGAATAFERDETAPPIHFHLGTDGSGYKTIMIPHGGSRVPFSADTLTEVAYEGGIVRNNCQLVLEGMDVFSFGITQAPKTVNALLNGFQLDVTAVDYFVFHQANMMMNKMIAKKLKLPAEKVPYSLKDFGNTSSATIPLTMVTELRENITDREKQFVWCGFGVGLSWGTMHVQTKNLVCSQLVEI